MMSLHVICGLGLLPIKNFGYAYVQSKEQVYNIAGFSQHQTYSSLRTNEQE